MNKRPYAINYLKPPDESIEYRRWMARIS